MLERIKGFIQWYEEDPQNRVVSIDLRLRQNDKDYSVFVMDRKLGVGQIVNDASEIDLVGKLKFDLQRKMKQAEKFL